MSAPVRTIRPEATVDQARRILLRYGHSGLTVADGSGQVVGIISRRDLDIALHHGFGHATVKGYMSAPVRTIRPDTLLPEIESLMVTYDIGRLPVLEEGQLVGIVTRTDVLRQLYQRAHPSRQPQAGELTACLKTRLQTCLPGALQAVMTQAAEQAEQRGWQLYLVGGAVRDLLLTVNYQTILEGAPASCLPAQTFRELDLVVDGVKNHLAGGAGVDLARSLQQVYPEAQLQIYGQFQTAALHWGTESPLQGFSVDIATARSEFYPYPAAHPEVTASSIRQDLYRRDFTINALAIRLTSPRSGELLDFFGGVGDLHQRQIRVLHPNSFIEDPTRIFRAVRFAVRLGFHLEEQTEQYIRHAIASGIYERTQAENHKAPSLQSRLKNELKYIIQEAIPARTQPFPGAAALQLLADLGALQCIHPHLFPDRFLWRQLRLGWAWFVHFRLDQTPVKAWELLIEILLAHLPAEQRGEAALYLHLGESAQRRLATLATLAVSLGDSLSCPPSQITHLLDPYDRPTLILLATQVPVPMRRVLWLYLNHWSQVPPLLNGHDLRQLGYLPGKQFRHILEHLRWQTLDGKIVDRRTALTWLQQTYPLSKGDKD